MAMAKPKAAGGGAAGGKTAGFDESAMACLEARIKAEMDSQINFGSEWGSLVGAPPTIDDAIEAKRKELAELKAAAAAASGRGGGGGAASATFTSTARSQFMDSSKAPLEAGLKLKR